MGSRRILDVILSRPPNDPGGNVRLLDYFSDGRKRTIGTALIITIRVSLGCVVWLSRSSNCTSADSAHNILSVLLRLSLGRPLRYQLLSSTERLGQLLVRSASPLLRTGRGPR